MKKSIKVAAKKFRSLDIFGESYAQKLEGDETVIQSYFGSICSVLIAVMTILYALQKLDVIISKKDVDILSTVKEGFFDQDYVFSYKNRLNIAAAFTGYDEK